MLKDDEKSLYGEIKAAEEERDQHLRHFKKMVQRSHGKAYKAPGSLSHGSTLENHYHEYVSLMLPRLVLNNPKVRVTSRDDSAMVCVSGAVPGLCARVGPRGPGGGGGCHASARDDPGSDDGVLGPACYSSGRDPLLRPLLHAGPRGSA
ncbi:MAG: hypothetical protein EBT12_11010 [Marivivens sp.]|nr:hypothetical protein [Marivivens sp.]